MLINEVSLSVVWLQSYLSFFLYIYSSLSTVEGEAMNAQVDDPMLLISHYYPVGMMSHFVTEKGEKVKGRRRRRKNRGGEEEAAGVMRKRKLSEVQVNMLEKSFGSEHKLESDRKDRLAAELGLDPRQVAVWFQNRRARWKNKKLEEEYSKLRSVHESTVLEKCRLETELIKTKEQLDEAEKEIRRLSSNSPSSSSVSIGTNMEPPFLAHQFADDVFYDFDYWDHNIYCV